MDGIINFAGKVPNYIRRFGLFAGLRLLLDIESVAAQQQSARIHRITVPGFDAPFFLRRQRGDHSTFWQCVVRRQYDISAFPQRARLLAAYREQVGLGRRPLIIDGGANIGLSARCLAPLFPQARVFAIEPDAHNVVLCERNLAPLGKQAVVLQGALWNEAAHLRIANPEAGSAAFRVEALTGAEPGTVRAYTIADICALAAVEAPFIVKLDIEGSQTRLFSSATDWVAKTHLIMLELDDWLLPWQGTSRAFFSCLSRYPFDYLIAGETIFCFRDFGERGA